MGHPADRGAELRPESPAASPEEKQRPGVAPGMRAAPYRPTRGPTLQALQGRSQAAQAEAAHALRRGSFIPLCTCGLLEGRERVGAVGLCVKCFGRKFSDAGRYYIYRGWRWGQRGTPCLPSLPCLPSVRSVRLSDLGACAPVRKGGDEWRGEPSEDLAKEG